MSIKILVILLLIVGSIGIIYLTATYPVLVPHQDKEQVKVIENIAYINDTNPKHRLDVYVPANTTNFPVVHFIHGGYWSSGDKNYFAFGTGLYKNIGYTLAKNGIGVVIQNYRLYPEASMEDMLLDTSSAVAWTVNNIAPYGGDPHKIFLMGHSAGGHLVSLLGSDPSYLNKQNIGQEKIKGVIAMSPLWDIENLIKNKEEMREGLLYPLFGTDATQYGKYSPKTYLNTHPEKFFVLLGENDYDSIKEEVNTIVKTVSPQPPSTTIAHSTHIDMVTQIGKKTDQVTPLLLEFIQK